MLMSCKGLPPNAPIAPHCTHCTLHTQIVIRPMNSLHPSSFVVLMSCKGLPLNAPIAPIAPYTLKLLSVPWTRYIPLHLSC